MLFQLLRGPTVEGRLYRRMAAFWSLAPPKKRRGRRRGRERLARKKLTRRSEFTSINRNRRIRFKMEPFLGRLLNRHVAYGLHL